jgi:DNA-binding NarL/FixJ family response regulator
MFTVSCRDSRPQTPSEKAQTGAAYDWLRPLATLQEEPLDRLRILLADDHPDFLAVAARLLESEFEVIQTVGDGLALIDEAARLEPDAVVLDISMPGLNGIEAVRHLKAAGSRAKVVFLTVHADEDYVRAALAAGSQGYVVKSRIASDLLLALREALAGREFVSPSISQERAD